MKSTSDCRVCSSDNEPYFSRDFMNLDLNGLEKFDNFLNLPIKAKSRLMQRRFEGKLRRSHLRRDLHLLQHLQHHHHDEGRLDHLWAMGLWQ
jgi:hypothetical protein